MSSKATYTQNFDLQGDWRLAVRAISDAMVELLEEGSRRGQEKLLATDTIAWRNLASHVGHDPIRIEDDELRGVAGVEATPRTMHAWAVESGLKPGKWRPIDPLQAWAEQKFGVDEDEARAIAVGTQRKLHAQGSQGVFFMRDALELIMDDAARRLEAAMASVFA